MSSKIVEGLRRRLTLPRLLWPFPRSGGGWGRRYLRIQKDLYFITMLTPVAHPYKPLTFFDFTDPHDAMDARRVDEKDFDGWRISDDGVIGGYSKCTAHFVPGNVEDPYEDEEQSEETDMEKSPNKELEDEAAYDEDDDEEESSLLHIPQDLPHLRWEGSVDTTVGLESKFDRAGFAALRSPEFAFGGVNLMGSFDALEVICRSDSRVYTINLTVDSIIPNDIYQGRIVTNRYDGSDSDISLDDRPWDVLYLPFQEFGSGGRRLENNVRLESLGFTLMDGKDGPFQFDLARVRAVNFFQGRVWTGPGMMNSMHGMDRQLPKIIPKR